MSSPSEPTTHADTNQLERDLMHRAAQMLANSDPQSLTAAAAVIVLTARRPASIYRVSDRDEQPEAVAELIAGLHQLVVADPDSAVTWALPLRKMLETEKRILDPEKWEVGTTHKSRAAFFIGCKESEIHSIHFDKDGRLVAFHDDHRTIIPLDEPASA